MVKPPVETICTYRKNKVSDTRLHVLHKKHGWDRIGDKGWIPSRVLSPTRIKGPIAIAAEISGA
jgi:hypothetical protein